MFYWPNSLKEIGLDYSSNKYEGFPIYEEILEGGHHYCSTFTLSFVVKLERVKNLLVDAAKNMVS